MQNLDEEDNKEPVGDVNDVAAVGPLLQLLPLQDGTDHVPCVEHRGHSQLRTTNQNSGTVLHLHHLGFQPALPNLGIRLWW